MKRYLPILLTAVMVAMISCDEPSERLTILHTNDTHSQIEPKSNNLGGYARRMGIIAQERMADSELLLVDAGDFSQGTPFFNFFHGRVEIDALNRMGYDAATLGNHEFDNGLDTLAMLLRKANFPVVCANYDCTGTPIEGLVLPYTIVHKNGHKVGIFGIGVNPESLIAPKNFGNIKYLEPYAKAQEMASLLRHDKHCDVVVCLSHLGTLSSRGDACDSVMASQTRDIDVIIGGHTHKMHDLRVVNPDGKETVVVQMGKSGQNVGKIELNFATK